MQTSKQAKQEKNKTKNMKLNKNPVWSLALVFNHSENYLGKVILGFLPHPTH